MSFILQSDCCQAILNFVEACQRQTDLQKDRLTRRRTDVDRQIYIDRGMSQTNTKIYNGRVCVCVCVHACVCVCVCLYHFKTTIIVMSKYCEIIKDVLKCMFFFIKMEHQKMDHIRQRSLAEHDNAVVDATSLLEDCQVVEEDSKKTEDSDSLKGDRLNIALLMFLYILQGIPLGIAASVPYLLQGRHVNYKDQAVFSFVSWPFSMKLLWAPIVDAIYLSAFGKRKSWLVPTQYLISLFMFILSKSVNDLMGDSSTGHVNVYKLTCMFFVLNFLAATQDIATDGWALTLLSRYYHYIVV